MEDITPQQKMVLEQRYVALAQSLQTATHLDSKLASTLQINTILVSVLGRSVLIGSGGSMTFALSWKYVLPIAALALYVISLLLITFIVMPMDYAYAGAVEWDDVWSNYLHVPLDAAYQQTLSDVTSATIVAMEKNLHKAWALTALGWSMLLQLLALVAANVLRLG